MHHGNSPNNRKECNLHALWKISAVCVAKECRDAAFHIAFAIHVSLGSTQPPLLRSTPRAARVAPLEEVVTAHPHHRALRNTNQPHGMGAVPPRKKIPGNSPLPRVARTAVSLCLQKAFFQSRTRPHHTPVKTFGPLQHTLPPPGRVRPLAARRSKWDHKKHQFKKVRPPPQQSRSPFLTKACSGRRHAQSQSNGLPRESRNGDAPLLWKAQQKNVLRSPREQHTLNRIQLHYCGHPHTQHECDNAGKEARNNTTHPSHKGQAASVLPSTIIPPHITPLHIRSKRPTQCTLH
ncbi:hypothetical protein TCDM_11174 [Trypanosoma cruzi Dm28c]|uniref:Uncharacterized protein n=1 Tax=Trypanosoma cruzi Dm28c TaxID=1416333 RepID=V5BA40_TRYCR|nr:hypothetical protein TCDM_11174 [Trypanosoma cruzi Dm28c]